MACDRSRPSGASGSLVSIWSSGNSAAACSAARMSAGMVSGVCLGAIELAFFICPPLMRCCFSHADNAPCLAAIILCDGIGVNDKQDHYPACAADSLPAVAVGVWVRLRDRQTVPVQDWHTSCER